MNYIKKLDKHIEMTMGFDIVFFLGGFAMLSLMLNFYNQISIFEFIGGVFASLSIIFIGYIFKVSLSEVSNN